jgi:hypothetical protein
VFDQARADLDDVTAALPLHGRHGGLGGEEDTVDVGGHHPPVQLFRDIRDRAGAPYAGVVDQRVDAAEPLERGLNDSPRDGRFADIARTVM